uniref:glycosyltransferase family 2 protein n=1 Tax=Agathobacter sp. TaxID=2021311 RepID=UPI00405609E8
MAVLMSTYNGEKYIVEQLDSILAQEDVEVHLYIRDDGSTDNTINIINGYANDNIFLYQDGENLGPGMSFMRLLYKVVTENDSYQYYAFADQDDIWLKNKISVAVNQLKEKTEAALYCSNQYLYIDGEVKGLRFDKRPELTLVSHISHNNIYGCTMIFNRKLATTITNAKCPGHDILDYRCHDTWVLLVALLYGNVVYDEKSYIYYRIHDDNAVGIRKMTFSDRIKRAIVGKKGAKVPARNLRMRSAQLLLDGFQGINDEDFVILRDIAEYQESFQKKIRLMKNSLILETIKENPIFFAIKVICNMV